MAYWLLNYFPITLPKRVVSEACFFMTKESLYRLPWWSLTQCNVLIGVASHHPYYVLLMVSKSVFIFTQGERIIARWIFRVISLSVFPSLVFLVNSHSFFDFGKKLAFVKIWAVNPWLPYITFHSFKLFKFFIGKYF